MILIYFLIQSSFAFFDLQYGAQARTFPMLGGEIFTETGYNFLVWGEKKDKNPFYGFIRPNIKANLSGVVNSASAEFEIYPVSFIGLSAGSEYTDSQFDFPFFDCDEIQCRGQLKRSFVQSKMALGFKGIISTINLKTDYIDHSVNSRDYGDFRKGMRGHQGHDILFEKRWVLGKTFEDKMVGVMFEESHYEISEDRNHTSMVIYQFKNGQNTYVFGAGKFETKEVGLGHIVVFRWQFDEIKSLRLF
jgi:hypothetical protein